MTDASTWTALAQKCRDAKNSDPRIDKAISIAAFGSPSLVPICNNFTAVQDLLKKLLPDHWFSVSTPSPHRPKATADIGKGDYILQEEHAATIEYALLAAIFEIMSVNATA